MTRLIRLIRDARGTGAIEMAIVLPVLVSFIWGIFQLGLLFQASAGMQNGLLEAARYATLHPTPTDPQIRDRVTAKTFGTYNGKLDPLVIENFNDAAGVTKYKEFTLVYAQKLDVLFMSGPTVTLTRKKRVYLSV
ncbi:MAG TPA: TadE/TadG family type IV pilus assembly protein [Sphingomicrobium sp.]|nr:TadE/TadG family type IV pilus assembly protein [Sphingomicrobium sp.]